jgi:hypothetical protein
MKKIITTILFLFLTACADYHLAKITETFRSSKQIYHINQYKKAVGNDYDQCEYEMAHRKRDSVGYSQGFGSFITSVR